MELNSCKNSEGMVMVMWTQTQKQFRYDKTNDYNENFNISFDSTLNTFKVCYPRWFCISLFHL